MKKYLCLLLILITLLLLTACQTNENSDPVSEVDLTQLSPTMVYAEVYNMRAAPDDYIGKIIKLKGNFSVYTDPDSGKTYFSCLVSDASACCSQGIEFIWEGEHDYPGDYPEIDAEITVTGKFETYDEDGYLYCRLNNAELDF